jgi:nicotinamidase-related amidase
LVDFDLIPERSALVNVDIQNCFVERAHRAPEVVDRINQLATACRRAGILVVHTRHVLRPDHANIGLLAELVPRIRDGMLDEGAESAAFFDGLEIDPHDVLLVKPRFGAFHGTDLEVILRSRGIDSVIITGITTDVCCDTTAREANARDFKVFFLSDATTTSAEPPEEVQRATLELIEALFGQVLTSNAMIAKIDSATASAPR